MRVIVRYILGGLLVLGTCALAAAAPTTSTKVARPTEAVDPSHCVTVECHSQVTARRVLHGPVSANACDSCHELKDAKAHTFASPRQGAQMCTYCHEFSVANMPVVHRPVADGQCLGCHDPHGGKTSGLLREDSMAELCGRCHEDIARDKKVMHTPAGKGQCDSCHPPHAAKFAKLLDAVGADLCLACHSDMEKRMALSKFTHRALEKGCPQCHDAHGSAYAASLTQTPAEMCLSCHDKVKSQVTQAKHKHSVVTQDKACMTCHTPHSGDIPKLMSDVPAKVCMGCHAEKVANYTTAAVPEVADPKTIKHGPIRDGQCGGCHLAHGSDQPLLLAKAYSDSLYQPFTPERYALCFACHDVGMVQQERTDRVTNFRNGQRNLHYVHVRAGTWNRNCAMCHDTHAGTNDRIVRDEVQYKTWAMRLNFARTGTGGSCAPGCHIQYKYDREHPTTAPATLPSAEPEPTLVRAEPLPMLRWSARDAAGTEVVVPDAGRPTVILLVRDETSNVQDVLKPLTGIIPDASGAQVVLVLCGSRAGEQAKSLIQSKSVAWPTVVDADQAIAGQFDVHAWPTAMVVQSDGRQIAKITATSESLALRLQPYLDLATAKGDPAAIKQQLAQQAIAAEDPAKTATRLLHAAERMLADGKAEQSDKLLTDAIQAHPDSIPLKVQRIKTALQLKRGYVAYNLLDRLPANSLPIPQHELLRGEALVLMERWADAKAALTTALGSEANSGQAHYLLGQVYEHEQDWQKAAQEYRAMHEPKVK